METSAARKVTDEGVLSYINADMAFHLYLLGLAGDEQLAEIVRVLRSRSRLHGLRDESSAGFMLECAREHLELMTLIIGGRMSAVDDLLQRHLSLIAADWPPD